MSGFTLCSFCDGTVDFRRFRSRPAGRSWGLGRRPQETRVIAFVNIKCLTQLISSTLYFFQIEGFEVKRVDEYHLTGIALDMFVKWERRAPSSGDGRGENRNEGRADGKPKSEQNKFEDGHFTEGLVGLAL